MKTKKFLSLALASTLALSMAIPAFAAPGGSTTTTPPTDTPTDTPTDNPSVTPTPQEPGKLSFDYSSETWTEDDVVIDISMPTATSSNIILNPYKLNYVDETGAAPAVKSNPVVVGKYNYVENNSSFAVDVNWEITGTAGGGVKFVEKAPAATATEKEVYLPIVLNGVKAKTVPAANIDTKLKAVKAEKQASTEKTMVVLDGAGDSKHLGVSGDALHFLCFGIKPYTTTGSGSNVTYSDGATLNNGAKLAEDWTAEDSVGVSMIFTFSKHK